MGLDGPVKLKITESVCGFVAIGATGSRLWIRRERFWWDDAWAAFSMLNLFVQIAGVFMHVDDPHDLSKLNRVAAYYLIATTFYAIIWSARLSILFSILRIDPDQHWRRRLKFIAALFVAALLFFLAQLLWVCERQPHWKDRPSPQCPLTMDVAICQLVSDVIADLLLITLPLRLIRSIRETALRRRLIVIFSTSIVTTIVSLVHASFILTTGGIDVVLAAFVEDCMSLTVANLPVVATALLRLLPARTSRSLDALSDDTTHANRTHMSTFRFRPFSLSLRTIGGDAQSRFSMLSRAPARIAATAGPTQSAMSWETEPARLDVKVPAVSESAENELERPFSARASKARAAAGDDGSGIDMG
ncbi:hypothetical protein OF83DRAFT_537700 [Amylostereum chailletii]|nr:hypothetical protein OF83DRAFT_537700 [Amylostereum chailletii]